MLKGYVDGLVQDCSNSNVLAMELLQSCTKPLLHIFTIRYELQICIDSLVQDCSISFANPLEILQSCIKPSISFFNNETVEIVLKEHKKHAKSE